jgi:hypothetical protein
LSLVSFQISGAFPVSDRPSIEELSQRVLARNQQCGEGMWMLCKELKGTRIAKGARSYLLGLSLTIPHGRFARTCCSVGGCALATAPQGKRPPPGCQPGKWPATTSTAKRPLQRRPFPQAQVVQAQVVQLQHAKLSLRSLQNRGSSSIRSLRCAESSCAVLSGTISCT